MAGPFGLVDCARDPALLPLVKLSPAHASLFAGRSEPEMEAASPYLVDLSQNPQLTAEWRSTGWGRSWGVIVHSSAALEELRRHFRHFLLAELPDGAKVMFRFYDPRVLRPFLPTCTPEELSEWFAKVEAFVMEGRFGGSVTYTFDGQMLRTS